MWFIRTQVEESYEVFLLNYAELEQNLALSFHKKGLTDVSPLNTSTGIVNVLHIFLLL